MRRILITGSILLMIFFTGCAYTPGESGLDSVKVECDDCNNVLHISSDFDEDGKKYFYFDDSSHPLLSDSYCPICSYEAAKNDMAEEIHMKLDDEIAIKSTEVVGIIYDYVDDADLAEKIIDEIYSTAAVNLGPLLEIDHGKRSYSSESLTDSGQSDQTSNYLDDLREKNKDTLNEKERLFQDLMRQARSHD